MNCSILDHGARIGDALQTGAIQRAIDAVFAAGGGEVVIPAGIYRTGGLRLRSGVTLHLLTGAMLEGSRDPDDYEGWRNDSVEPIPQEETEGRDFTSYATSRWCNALIRALDAENVAIIGEPGSFIDGANVYDPTGEEHYRGPHLISMWRCRNITLRGYTVKNSSNWAHALFQSAHIRTEKVTVIGGHDGFDIRTCDDVTVEDCAFYTGDDSIAGFDNCDVVIRRCLLNSSCSALRFGGTDVLVEDCRAEAPTAYAFRGDLPLEEKKAGACTSAAYRHSLFSGFLYYCDYRAEIRKTPGNILIRNCVFENPDSLFILNFGLEHRWACNRSLSSITYENCTVTGMQKPVFVKGDAAEPLAMILRNVTFSPREGCEDQPVLDARNFSGILLDHVTFPGYPRPTAVLRSEGTLTVTGGDPVRIVRDDSDPHQKAF